MPRFDVTAPTTKSRGHLWICNQCIAAPMQLFNNNTIESLPLLRYLLLHCMEVEQYKCYYNGIHPTTEVVGFLPVRVVNLLKNSGCWLFNRSP